MVRPRKRQSRREAVEVLIEDKLLNEAELLLKIHTCNKNKQRLSNEERQFLKLFIMLINFYRKSFFKD